MLGGGEGITEVDRRSLGNDRGPPVDMLCRYLNQVTLLLRTEVSELPCTATGQNDVDACLEHTINVGKIAGFIDLVGVIFKYGTDRHADSA